jgi:hypothetical protein
MRNTVDIDPGWRITGKPEVGPAVAVHREFYSSNSAIRSLAAPVGDMHAFAARTVCARESFQQLPASAVYFRFPRFSTRS